MRIEFYENIKRQVRISDIIGQRILLKRKNNEYLGLCPFHDEKTPSFTVNDIKAFYHCFGCGAHGDVIKFVAETNGIGYRNAAIKIANDNGIDIPKISEEQSRKSQEIDRICYILNLANQFFVDNLSKDHINILKERGLSEDTIKNFSIGFAPAYKLQKFFEQKKIYLRELNKAGLVGKKENFYDIFSNRITFPIFDIYNKVIGFGGRTIKDIMPKYINSPESLAFKKGEIVYGENVASRYIYKNGYSILVEGYIDVISLHQAGFKEAIATLGTAITEKQLQKLWSYGDEIVICLDGDRAGKKAKERLIDIALPHLTANKKLSFINLDKNDPDDFIRSNGKEAFLNILKDRMDLSKTLWDLQFSRNSTNSAESRTKLQNELNIYCKKIEDNSFKRNLDQYFRDMIWKSRSGKSSKIINTPSKNVLNTQKYSEIDIIEGTICNFIIKHPHVIKEYDKIHDINFLNNELNALRHQIIELIEEKNLKTEDSVKNAIKNTGLFNIDILEFSVFREFVLPHKDNFSVEVLEWLCKKHYLLLLTEEHIYNLNDDLEKNMSKSSMYIKEIQETSQQLLFLAQKIAEDSFDK